MSRRTTDSKTRPPLLHQSLRAVVQGLSTRDGDWACKDRLGSAYDGVRRLSSAEYTRRQLDHGVVFDSRDGDVVRREAGMDRLRSLADE